MDLISNRKLQRNHCQGADNVNEMLLFAETFELWKPAIQSQILILRLNF